MQLVEDAAVQVFDLILDDIEEVVVRLLVNLFRLILRVAIVNIYHLFLGMASLTFWPLATAECLVGTVLIIAPFIMGIAAFIGHRAVINHEIHHSYIRSLHQQRKHIGIFLDDIEDALNKFKWMPEEYSEDLIKSNVFQPGHNYLADPSAIRELYLRAFRARKELEELKEKTQRKYWMVERELEERKHLKAERKQLWLRIRQNNL